MIPPGPGAPFGALSDIVVLDLTQMLAGPYGSMMLADHGALVIKIEPLTGDVTRGSTAGTGPPEGVLSGYFQSVNRNKRSVCLDLKSDAGREAFKALVRHADAVVENFRAGVMERLGLGYELLREINPRLVYGALRGFGDHRTGASEYSHWPAYDVVAQAMGGIMGITGPAPDAPTKVGPGIGDIVPGMNLAFGVLAAIHNARRTGEGQFVDVAMVDSVLAVCERIVWQHSSEGRVAGPEGNHHPFICPFGIFPAADGAVTIAAQQDDFFRMLAAGLDAPELAEDPRFRNRPGRTAHREDLIQLISARTRTFTKRDLASRLGGRVPFGPVMNILDIERDPHFAIREMIAEVEQPNGETLKIAGVPIRMTETPGGVRRRGPLLGEDTLWALAGAGLSPDDVQHLLDRGAGRSAAESAPAPVAARAAREPDRTPIMVATGSGVESARGAEPSAES
jgi:crotonobetainyl-CoA:carnitine CoA-transferase CaiB-like acyl-CoA transferase